MSDRASVFEGIQIGVEATPGTSVAANKRLLATAISPSIMTEPNEFAPTGYKYETVVVNGKEWTEAGIEGVGSYNDPVYLFSSAFGAAAITTPTTGTGVTTAARDWNWAPLTTGPDAGKTYTIEQGSSVRAEKVSGGIITALSMSYARSGVSVGGSMMGQLTTDGITLTASPTDIALEPIVPNQVDIYLDDTFATIGTTKLTRCIEAGWELSDKNGPIWPLNSTNASYAASIETKPQGSANLTLGADSSGMALLPKMRVGQTMYLRIKATGRVIDGAFTYLHQVDIAVKILNPGEKGDSDGLRTIPWEFRAVHDSTMGGAFKIKHSTTLTAL